MKTTTQSVANTHKRIRVQHDFSHPKITDPSYQKMCDINFIMAQYAKTGMLPHYKEKSPQYIDNTQLPDLIGAFNLVNDARELFQDLPAIVRKAMDNDPSQLESFVSDENNQAFLLQHGVLEQIQKPEQPNSLSQQDIANLKDALQTTEQKTQP